MMVGLLLMVVSAKFKPLIVGASGLYGYSRILLSGV
jgi:hypothetical protein